MNKIYIFIVACLLILSACDVTKPDPNGKKGNGRIIITLQSDTVILGLQGNGEITINIEGESNKKINGTNFKYHPFKFADSEIRIIEILGEVTRLNISSNHVTELDISESPKLIYLDSSNNLLNSLKINKNTQLKEINISNNQLSAE